MAPRLASGTARNEARETIRGLWVIFVARLNVRRGARADFALTSAFYAHQTRRCPRQLIAPQKRTETPG